MDICYSFLKNDTINPKDQKPLTKEQKIEFIKLCGFSRVRDNDISTLDLQCKTILENYKNDKCITTQIQGSLDNINLWFISQINYLKNINNISLIDFYEKAGFYEWNSILRGLKDPCYDLTYNKGKKQSSFKVEFEQFYQLITKAPQCPNMIVYRGETYDDFDTFNLPYSNDGKIENKGFTSTSLNKIEALKYSLYKMVNGNQEINKDKKVIYQIELPAGTPALFISLRKYPSIDDRLEIVLPPHILRYVKDIEPIQYSSSQDKFSSVIVKRFKVETILPFNFVIKGINNTFSEEIIINEVFQRLKQDNITWEVNGIYGLNLLLKHRYKMKNLIPVNTLYLKGYYYKLKDKLNEHYDANMFIKINELLKEIMKKYNIENRFKQTTESGSGRIKYIVNYEVCPNMIEDVIKIDYLEDYYHKSMVDNELYKKLNLPIKTALGYIEEIKNVLSNKETHSDFNTKDKKQLENMLNILENIK